jgi:formate dehydrogenase iron-sulfur subunit
MSPKAMIQDNTRCIGCRACMIACKAWNNLPGDTGQHFFAGAGYQNPRDLDARNYTVITYSGIEAGPNGQPDWVFGRLLCMHCVEPACASACPTTALRKTPEGPVVFNSFRCIGCRYCMQACPFVVPKFEFDRVAPVIHKCTFCADRIAVGREPACAQVCPTAAITFGEREDMVKEARHRIASAPTRYVPHIYGLDEVGGTSILHLSSVPFEQLGYPTNLPDRPPPTLTQKALHFTPKIFTTVWITMALITMFVRRRFRFWAEDEHGENHDPPH